MKKSLSLFFILISLSISVNAESVFVTDTIKFTLRSDENNRSKILKMVPTGTMLSLIDVNTDSGYSFVRTDTGVEGYILTRHTKNRPVSSWYLKKATKKLASLQKKHDSIKKELDALKKGNTSTRSSNKSLTNERNSLSKDLKELRQTAANALQLKHQRDKLEERVISVERELQQVKRENMTLEDSANQDWFLYGGILSLLGVLFGFILPKLSWHRKSSNWDSF